MSSRRPTDAELRSGILLKSEPAPLGQFTLFAALCNNARFSHDALPTQGKMTAAQAEQYVLTRDYIVRLGGCVLNLNIEWLREGLLYPVDYNAANGAKLAEAIAKQLRVLAAADESLKLRMGFERLTTALKVAEIVGTEVRERVSRSLPAIIVEAPELDDVTQIPTTRLGGSAPSWDISRLETQHELPDLRPYAQDEE